MCSIVSNRRSTVQVVAAVGFAVPVSVSVTNMSEHWHEFDARTHSEHIGIVLVYAPINLIHTTAVA